MCAEQLQGQVLPSDQIASHNAGEVRPPELIAADPVDHFRTVSGRAIYNAKREMQAVKDGISVIIHQQTLTPDIYWFSTAKPEDHIFHATDLVLSGRLYQPPVFLPDFQGI